MNPKFAATDDRKKLVLALTGLGVTHEHIARKLGCDKKTLYKHFREELDHGADEANMNVAAALHKSALKGNSQAQVFWMKARAGWQDRTEITGKDGAPLIAPVQIVFAERAQK